MDTSPFAYEHVLRVTRGERAFFKAVRGGMMERSPSREPEGGILRPLFWLYHLIIRLTVGVTDDALEPLFKKVNFKDPVFVSKYSRGTRKFLERNGFRIATRRARVAFYIQKLIYGGLTARQKQGKQVRLSPLGRVHVYGLVYWATRKSREAGMAGLGILTQALPRPSVTQGGLSIAQLPPD